MQLDVDLNVLRRETGLEPVQLAIDGALSFVPELEKLAADPTVRGTLLVSYIYDAPLLGRGGDRTDEFESEYEWSQNQRFVSFRTIEPALDDTVHSLLRSYADGTRPFDALNLRVLRTNPSPQFVETFSDRSQRADFRRVSLPDYYYRRVQRWLNITPPLPQDRNFVDLDITLRQKMATIRPADNSAFLQALSRIESLVTLIRARGGQVVFVNLPSSGLILEMEHKRYPRDLYWDQFAASTSAPSLNFEDDPILSRYTCPDGSHLDFRDRSSFTDALVHALKLERH